MKTTIAVASLLALTAFAGYAQETGYEEEVDVSLVLIDAVVVDDRGNQILGLGPEDFVVTEDGVEQRIESVEYFSNRRSLDDPSLDSRLRLNRDSTNRYFILMFDKADGAFQTSGPRNVLLRAVRDAKKFIGNELVDGDLVAIAGFDARLELYSDFTDDREQLGAALEQVYRYGSGIEEAPDAEPSLLSKIDRDRMIKDTGRIYDALELMGEGLQQLPGRKVLMLFTPGFGSGPFGTEDDIWFEPMIESLNQANVSAYVFNLLDGSTVLETTTARLALETGGKYYRTPVSFTRPLASIENLNNGYYLISYKPKHEPGASGYQHVDVKLRNSEFRISARDGYRYGSD